MDGALMAPITLIISLSLSMTCGALYRASGLAAWRAYGRLGRGVAGFLFGLGLCAAMAFVLLFVASDAFVAPTEAAGDSWPRLAGAGFVLAPFLIPVLALAATDALLALVAALVLGAGLPALLGLEAMLLAPLPLLMALVGAWLRRAGAHSQRRWALLLPGILAACIALPFLLLARDVSGVGEAGMIAALAILLLFVPVHLMLRRLIGAESQPETDAGTRNQADMGGADIGGAGIGNVGQSAPLIGRAIADLPEGVAIFDAADRLVACNETFRRFNAEIAADLVPGAAYAALVRAAILRGPARPDPEATIAAHLAKHADLPWREETVDSGGRALMTIESRTQDGGSLRIMSDITAIKGREARLSALAERNAVLATAVASVSSGIVICDATRPGLPVTFVNAAFTRITGYQPTEILGLSCRALQGRDTDAEAVERMRRAIARQKPVTITLRNYRKDGRTFWNELSISPIADETGRVTQFVGIVNDVTQRIRAEENLRETKNQAEMANRAKSDFLANVSHELRTPLNAIIGFSEVMQMELFGALGAPQYRIYAKDVHDSGQHLLSLINDILDLSKIEAGKMELYPEPIALDEILESCQRLVRDRAAKAGVRLAVEIERDLPLLFMDLRALKQVVTNLLSNAVKFTPKGGQVRLSARLVGDGDARRAEIVIADSGIGIAKDDIEKVLQPFGQVDSPEQRRHAGTGLGLPIVKSLVDLSGGAFRLESELGKGTTVVLSLPFADPAKASQAA